MGELLAGLATALLLVVAVYAALSRADQKLAALRAENRQLRAVLEDMAACEAIAMPEATRGRL